MAKKQSNTTNPKKKISKVKKTKTVKKVEDKVESKVEATVEETKPVVEKIVKDAEDFTKKNITPEILLTMFDDSLKYIDDEINVIKESSKKTSSVKPLRSLSKQIKKLKSKTVQILKQKKKVKRNPTSNANSGFLKPVKISKEMCKFTGWKESELHSRVDVTKFLCKYIKDNNLQNPEDKRQIVLDNKLSKILKYDPAQHNGEPLTYFRIQSCIKDHFTNP